LHQPLEHNNILQTYQPHFFAIKSLYPHFHAGRGKSGHFVFYERPGDLEMAQVKENSGT
jgi:hypothetical protein